MSKIGNEPRIFIESGRWKPREVITLLIVESNHFILFILELFYLGPSNTVSRFFAEGHGSLQAKSNMKQLSYVVKSSSTLQMLDCAHNMEKLVNANPYFNFTLRLHT